MATGVDTNANSASPETRTGVVHVAPASCVTVAKIRPFSVAPLWPSRKSPYVISALPLPHAVTYSLSSRSPTEVSLPLPRATTWASQVTPPSFDTETRMSGFWALAGPTNRKPSVA